VIFGKHQERSTLTLLAGNRHLIQGGAGYQLSSVETKDSSDG
jgi:hypothetical protein